MFYTRIVWRVHRYRTLGIYRKHYRKDLALHLGKLIALLLLLLLINSCSMVYFDGLSWGNALWLSVTTATTVGYGDFSAISSEARWVTVISIYIFGIALLAQAAGEYFDYKIHIRELKTNGSWRWKQMQDHILLINTPNENTEQYLDNLLTQVRLTPELALTPIQILTRKFRSGLPNAIIEKDVVHYVGIAENDENLMAVNVSCARVILLLARDHTDPLSDSLTFDILHRISAIGTTAQIIAESTRDSNRKRMLEAGADIVIRPIRAYPELLVRSIVAPGTEAILENMFTHDGNHMERHNIGFQNKKWSDIICSFVPAGLGIPLAYIDNQQQVHCNPNPDIIISGNGIITLVHSDHALKPEAIQKALI